MDSQSTINIIIYSITAIFIVSLIAFTVIGGIAFSKTNSGGGKTFTFMFDRGHLLSMVTVLAVIIAALFLALTDKLNAGAVSLLSGVAGYVLGGMAKQKRTETNENIE